MPDVINNVPVASAQASATTCASTNTVSAPTPAKTADVSAQPSAAATSIPTTAVKPVPAPPQPNPNIPRATSLPSAASEASVKNRSSREEKARKKDDKSVEHVMRALNSLNTPEEKLAAMCKKYTEQIDEHRKLQVSTVSILYIYSKLSIIYGWVMCYLCSHVALNCSKEMMWRDAQGGRFETQEYRKRGGVQAYVRSVKNIYWVNVETSVEKRT